MREIEMRRRLGSLPQRRMQGMLAPALGVGLTLGACGAYGAQFPRGADASGTVYDGAGANHDVPIGANPGPDGAGAPEGPSTTDLSSTSDGSGETPGRVATGACANVLDSAGSARLSASVPNVDFGTIQVNTGISESFYLTNYGDVSTGPISIVATSGLSVTGCGSPLDVRYSCLLTISFRATTVGELSGTVTITANPGTVTCVELSVHATVI